MKAVSYLRVSTSGQQEEGTIQIQQFKIQEFIKRNDYELVEEFLDDGVSGSGLKNRPGLNRMLDCLQNSDVECVIIYKLDRLARNLYVQEGLIQEINKMGKKVISTLEPNLDGNDPFRKAFRQMLGIFSEFEKSMIALRLEGGRERKAQQGGWHGGKIYGYDNQNGNLVINQAEAEVINIIFKLRRSKNSYKKIAMQLTAMSKLTKRGNTVWRSSTVKKIVSNPMYKKGLITYKGHIYPSKNQIIIPKSF